MALFTRLTFPCLWNGCGISWLTKMPFREEWYVAFIILTKGRSRTGPKNRSMVFGVTSWRLFLTCKNMGVNLDDILKLCIGNGTGTLFLLDKWISGDFLASKCPGLFETKEKVILFQSEWILKIWCGLGNGSATNNLSYRSWIGFMGWSLNIYGRRMTIDGIFGSQLMARFFVHDLRVIIDKNVTSPLIILPFGFIQCLWNAIVLCGEHVWSVFQLAWLFLIRVSHLVPRLVLLLHLVYDNIVIWLW